MLNPQGPRHALLALVAMPESVAVLEGEEQRIPARLPGSPAFVAGLKLTKAERFVSLDAAAEQIRLRVLDCRTPLGAARRVTFLVDTSHYIAGPIAAHRLAAMRFAGRVYLGLLEITPRDMPRPERAGWRVVIGRRMIASALAQMIDSGRITVAISGVTAQEIRTQLECFRERPVKASEEDPLEGEDYARALALLAWCQSRQPATGGVVPQYAA